MADYNLFGLSTRSFEQMIQALAIPILGGSTIIFGDGPDGGREATFTNLASYPDSNAPWTGYGIVQAKFLQRTAGSGNDGTWALQQLKSELEKYPKSKGQKPEYYIYVTNVVLTPVQTSGGKDKISALMARQAKRLKLKGWAVWDYDQLRGFLDNNRDVARAYAAGITPGDVLTQMSAILTQITPDFTSTLVNFLQKELISEQYANLEQAGHNQDEKMLLSRVFIDLPVSEERLYEPPDEPKEGFIFSVLSKTSAKYDRASNDGRQINRGRYVLIGGPGQGKTTVGQYLCQLFRAALLRSAHALSIEGQYALDGIVSKCSAQGLDMPVFRRFPIRIELNSFAAALASGSTVSVFEHIRKRIAARTNRTITNTVLREWLGVYPWLIVFDGLDEVPATSNRDQLLASIKDFWIDLAECDADVFIVATSRPQGYTDDFSPTEYSHHYLTPLTPGEALKYGKLLTDARYGFETDRGEKVFSRLTRASTEPSTARLMRSPLQVTIMAALLDKLGQPPNQRWSLFREYYRTIYDREVERQIAAAEVLRSKRPDVDLIHYRLGVLLQLECERKGTTDARLRTADFEVMVRGKLSAEGHTGTELEALVHSILSAAAERLVFIVGLEQDQVGFEIRSLQEFMAAEGLMEGSDEVVRSRLRHIASLDSWRQVFIFAAGKCFVERRHLREFIYTICHECDLPESGLGYSQLRVGSNLALDLLEDGTVREQPKFEQLFVIKSLELLDINLPKYHIRLAGLYADHLRELYETSILERLGQAEPVKRIGAWTCLLELAKRGVDWAEFRVANLANEGRSYPNELGVALRAVRPPNMEAAYAAVLAFSEDLPGRDSEDWYWGGSTLQSKVSNDSPWLEKASILLRGGPVHNRVTFCRISDSGEQGLSVGFLPIQSDGIRTLPPFPEHSAAWEPFVAAAEFCEIPSIETLAKTLDAVASVNEASRRYSYSTKMPWPVSSLLRACSSQGDIVEMSSRVRAGELGDEIGWLEAEQRWQQGISFRDLNCEENGLPFGRDVGTFGFPVEAIRIIHSDGSSPSLARSAGFISQLHEFPQSRSRSAGAALILLGTTLTHKQGPTVNLVLDLIRDAAKFDWGILTAHYISFVMADDKWPELLDEIGRTASIFGVNMLTAPLLQQILEQLLLTPHALGLMRLAAYSAPGIGLTSPIDFRALALADSQEMLYCARALHLLSASWGTEHIPQLGKEIIASEGADHRPDMLQAIYRSQAPLGLRIGLLEYIVSSLPEHRFKFRTECLERLTATMALEHSSFASVEGCDLQYLQ